MLLCLQQEQHLTAPTAAASSSQQLPAFCKLGSKLDAKVIIANSISTAVLLD
jgi:hypothetical protein